MSPCNLLLTVIRRGIWCNSYFMLIGVGVSCRCSYSIVSFLYEPRREKTNDLDFDQV